ncbi:50S ribosomal protein L29 [Candidatus Peregrinibacteria bacterium]|nr:50S ribosomal protein L29 [Candidatus Peregrinibacteria bacterium]MBT5823961.1 50S ribosomal protein L29 [Candidatus Peregrinibacteria bacterium]
MANITKHTVKELRKMSKKDRDELLKKALPQKGHVNLHLKAGEKKTPHEKAKLKKLIARIHTLNSEIPLTKETKPTETNPTENEK